MRTEQKYSVVVGIVVAVLGIVAFIVLGPIWFILFAAILVSLLIGVLICSLRRKAIK